jgi:DNA modification methylase
MTATVIRGDARNLPLPDASVDLIVTSPPYWALRSYTDTPELCARCRELTGQGWEYPRASDESRDLRQAWPNWDAHVKAEHKAAHYDGQIGAEPTPAAYIDSLIECTREWMRVLKPSGSMWINLGDKYNSGSGAGPQSGLQGGVARTRGNGRGSPLSARTSLPPKSLVGLPWRYALQCIDDLGLILRGEVIWSKPNGLPESVTDRVRRSHEQWFHLVKSPRYFSAVDTIREAHSPNTHTGRTRTVGSESGNGVTHRTFAGNTDTFNPLGKLPGSVWTIATQPLKVPAELGVDHFAAFPMEWPRRIVQGWSPSGICTACGEGRRPVATSQAIPTQATNDVQPVDSSRKMSAAGWGERGKTGRSRVAVVVTGEACACTPCTDHPGTGERSNRRADNPYGENGKEQGVYSNNAGEYDRVGPWREYHFDRWTPAPTRPAVVLDPFGGTGTTALVAHALGRHGISVDMSADYCRLAEWRTTDPGQLAAALEVEKPPAQMAGQGSLLDLFGEVVA